MFSVDGAIFLSIFDVRLDMEFTDLELVVYTSVIYREYVQIYVLRAYKPYGKLISIESLSSTYNCKRRRCLLLSTALLTTMLCYKV